MQATTADSLVARERVIVVAKAVAVVVSIAALYWGICMLNPALAKSSVMGVILGKTIRLANLLRAACVVSPFAVMGTGLGAWLFNVTTGKAMFGIQPLITVIVTGFGLLAFMVSRKIGRSVPKDLLVIGVYGVVANSIIALNVATIAVLFTGEVWGQLLVDAVIWKIATGTLVYLAGYPFVVAFERLTKGMRTHGEDSSAQ